MEIDRNEVFRKALKQWGAKNREDKLVEEAGEFFQALIKQRYGQSYENMMHKLEELVDLGIMVDQLKFDYAADGFGPQIAEFEAEKLAKLSRKLESGEKF